MPELRPGSRECVGIWSGGKTKMTTPKGNKEIQALEKKMEKLEKNVMDGMNEYLEKIITKMEEKHEKLIT